MRKYILIAFLGMVGVLEAGGHYVCYEDRTIVHLDGNRYYMRYDGCMISRYSCATIGMRRFGHYPNDYETRKALRRCIYAKPRFVD